MKNFALLLLASVLSLTWMVRAEELPPEAYDQSKIPLEVDTEDKNLTKIVLLAGNPSHGPNEHEFFAGCALLKKMLEQNPGVFVVMAKGGWPKNEKIFENAKCVVFYMDGRSGHPLGKEDRLTKFQKYIDQGCGFVNLHFAVDYTKGVGATILKWMGGYYDAEISINPHWKGDFKEFPEHPVTRGVKPFQIQDEWYYNMKWNEDPKGLTHILKSVPPDATRRTEDAKKYPGRSETTAWTYERADGGRGFGFTGGHFHKNWGQEDFRRVVVNAVLWCAKLEIPKEGAKCDLKPEELMTNLDTKRKPQPKPPAPPAEKKPEEAKPAETKPAETK